MIFWDIMSAIFIYQTPLRCDPKTFFYVLRLNNYMKMSCLVTMYIFCNMAVEKTISTKILHVSLPQQAGDFFFLYFLLFNNTISIFLPLNSAFHFTVYSIKSNDLRIFVPQVIIKMFDQSKMAYLYSSHSAADVSA